MKRILIFLVLCTFLSVNTNALTHDPLMQYLPRNSFLIAGADFERLQNNEVYLSMERNHQLWSYDEGSDGIGEYVKLLNLDTQKDIQSFAFAKYLNNYGGSGKVHVFNLKRNLTKTLSTNPSTPYLQSDLYRLTPDRDMYAVLLTPSTIAVGNLNETKMAVDVMRAKVPSVKENATLSELYGKIPADAPIWGVSVPLGRRKAADANAKQSTNTIISGFQSYYFFGMPTKTAARTQFFGQTEDEKQASFISSFMIGTLLVTKLRADPALGEMLGQVDVQHTGNNVHVTMLITKEMVDAYYKGKLGF
jgi:hypothetical protein